MFSQKLEALSSKNRLRALSGASGIDLSSNDYLGLKDHPQLKRAALEAIERGVGLGAGASRLLRGNAPEHSALETYAAAHYGFDSALYFANGFSANYAVLTTLPSRHDVVIFDALVHASVRDGLQAGHAKAIKVAHNDLDAFEDALKAYRDQAQNLFIAVESLYSMDGDVAPLAALAALAQRYDTILIVDEAHSTGVFGEGGRGLSDPLPRENLIVIHTCGKALGVAGGLVCASKDVIDYLINAARPFIYSTAPPPLQALLTQAAIALCASAQGEEARAKLRTLCAITQDSLGGAGTQIIPIILGAEDKAMSIAADLQAQGYDIRAIRPPTVPEGTARLRLSLNAKLPPATLRDFLGALQPYLLKQAS